MSIRLVIGNQVINFPGPGSDAVWAEAVDDFAQAVADQLQGIALPSDISPRVQTLTSDTNTNLAIDGASFPSGTVRSFYFTYAIYRTNGVTSLAEEGVVNGVYNSMSSSWTINQQFSGPRQADGTQYHTFSMSGDQLTLTTVALGGSYDDVESKISYFAKTNLISNI